MRFTEQTKLVNGAVSVWVTQHPLPHHPPNKFRNGLHDT
jgi:hypothetical protein